MCSYRGKHARVEPVDLVQVGNRVDHGRRPGHLRQG